jgi:LAO/AO transport system kinase
MSEGAEGAALGAATRSAAHPVARGVLAGEERALARACRMVDDRVGDFRDVLKELFPHTGRAWVVGVTGTPGAGKSTLVDGLIALLRTDGARVGVLAIDPTSPYTGGAILGDRIRMQRHHGDAGVFIRSLATRGALGGLSRSAADLVRVLDAWGADVVLVETVGVGQDELEITRTAESTLVVAAPGMGDDVQAIKAGILECADVFAVNKADRPGAEATQRQLEVMIALGQEVLAATRRAPAHHGAHAAAGARAPAAAGTGATDALERWIPPVLKCVATSGDGTREILARLGEHRAWLRDTEAGRARRLERLGEAMRLELRQALLDAAEETLAPLIEEAVEAVARRERDPYGAAEALVARFRAGR